MTGVVLSSSGAGAPVLTAVLGPTNTGKTHLAMSRMLGHASGAIGFPLRLLARENYDRAVKEKGATRVALITGEEKIVPPLAQYFVCTVESMPLERSVDFLAVDEIQLAADPERGHIFTERLLQARGRLETMFLGAETIRPMIRRLVPGAQIQSRERLSSLTFTGHKKLTHLPPRSAITAFAAEDVYALAELVRRHRGGCAVVMGALSPRTRNAQVALYQAGEVDYLVATDAIGMGLNMDIDHVAFARLTKFDGARPRRLKATEIAQIAGRAGRGMSDGTFGTTSDPRGHDSHELLEPELLESVETHRFEPLKSIMWRNPTLDWSSPGALLRALDRPPPIPELTRPREADDVMALRGMIHDAEVLRLASNPGRVRLLWDVCQVPDFRKTMSDAHVALLRRIYTDLAGPAQAIPEDWVARQVEKLDRTEGDIDALMSRLAHVRTWTYIAYRPDWLADPQAWQERTRGIEDRISDTLHARLTERFVDRRSTMLVKGLKADAALSATVGRDGQVLVEGHLIGRLTGLSFVPELLPGQLALRDGRQLTGAARRVLRSEIAERVQALMNAEEGTIDLTPAGELLWQDVPVARLVPGPSPLQPGIALVNEELLEPAQKEQALERLQSWLAQHIRTLLEPLVALGSDKTQPESLQGAGRGIAFQIFEGLGAVERRQVQELVAGLTKEQRQGLREAGIRLAQRCVFMPAIQRTPAIALRALLWAVHHGKPLPAPLPNPGQVSTVTQEGWPAAYYLALGYMALGPRALRLDIAERLDRMLAKQWEDAQAAAPAPVPAADAATPSGETAADEAVSDETAPAPAEAAPLEAPEAAVSAEGEAFAAIPEAPVVDESVADAPAEAEAAAEAPTPEAAAEADIVSADPAEEAAAVEGEAQPATEGDAAAAPAAKPAPAGQILPNPPLRRGEVVLTDAIRALIGCPAADLPPVMQAMGFRPIAAGEDGLLRFRRGQPRPEGQERRQHHRRPDNRAGAGEGGSDERRPPRRHEPRSDAGAAPREGEAPRREDRPDRRRHEGARNEGPRRDGPRADGPRKPRPPEGGAFGAGGSGGRPDRGPRPDGDRGPRSGGRDDRRPRRDRESSAGWSDPRPEPSDSSPFAVLKQLKRP